MAKKKAQVADAVAPTGEEPKATRALSPYNQFMKVNVSKLKKETPGLAHKDAFKAAALAWATAPENPKNMPGAKPAEKKEKKGRGKAAADADGTATPPKKNMKGRGRAAAQAGIVDATV